ncbi:MAG TPA: PAS domain S-box protein [Methanospirillum sp.]|nr:PAS domain S-box protein [Methanospirillum sp.]
MKETDKEIGDLGAALQAYPEGISIQEVADLIGIHRNTAAKYLEVLQSRGEVDVRRVGVSKLFVPSRRIPFTNVIRLFDQPVIGIDRDRIIVGVNDAAAALSGRTPADLIGSPLWTIDVVSGSEIVEQIIGVARGAWKSWDITSTGLVFRVRGIPVKYSDGRTGAALLMFDQKEIEGARAEIARCTNILELISSVQTEYMVRWRMDLSCVWVNPALATLVSLPVEQLIGKRIPLRLPDEDYERFLKVIRTCTPEGSMLEYRVLLPSGDLRYHQATLYSLPDQGGYIGVGRDITDFKLKEEQFQRFYEGTETLLAERTHEIREVNRQLYQEISRREQIEGSLRSIEFAVQHVADLILWFTPDGQITYSNQAAQKSLQFDTLDGPATIQQFIHTPPGGDWSTFWEHIRSKQIFYLEMGLSLPDGGSLPVELLFNYLSYGSQEYCCCIARDVHERMQAMENIIESEGRFRELAGAITEIFYLMDLRTGKIMYVNPAFEEVFGIPVSRFYEDPVVWISMIHPDDRARVFSQVQDASHNSWETEFRIIRSDGSVRWLIIRIFSIRDSRADSLRQAGIIIDITERRTIEEEVRVLNDRLRTTLKASMVTVFNQDASLRYTWIENPGRGLTPHEVIGKGDSDLFPPDVAERLVRCKNQVITTGNGEFIDFNVSGDGHSFSSRVYVEPFRDASGEITGITGAAIDTSDLFLVREALWASEKKFRRFFDETDDISLLFSVIRNDAGEPVDFEYDDLNQRAISLLGRGKSDIVGRRLSAFRPDVDPQWYSSLSQVAQGGLPVRFDGYSEFFHRYISVNTFPIGEDRIGVLGRDISVLIRAYEQVEHQRDLALALSATDDLDTAFDLILDAGQKVPGIDSGGIYFVDEEEHRIRLKKYTGLSETFAEYVADITLNLDIFRVYQQGIPVYYRYGDFSPVKTPPHVLDTEELRSYAVLPLLDGDRLVALLNLGSHTLNGIPVSEHAYLESLAAHLGEILVRLWRNRGTGIDPQARQGPQFQILDPDGLILEGSAPDDGTGYALREIRAVIEKRKELLYTGQELTELVCISHGSPEYRVRIRFVPWGREVAYLVIWELL